MIRKAKFENFKGLRDVEVTFDSRFTVLVGPNGTGKTSVLQGVEFLSAFSTPQGVQLSLLEFRSRDAKGSIKLLGLDQNDCGWCYVDPPASGTVAAVALGTPPRVVPVERGKPVLDAPFAVKPVHFGSVLRPRFQASDVARPIPPNSTPPQVTLTGIGLPALLGYLKLRDDELFDRIEELTCEILPHVTKLRIDEQSNQGQAAPKSLLFDTKYGKRIPADQMSDGTLYILALIVAVLGPHRPKTLLIDDIDMRLHPKAQYELVTLLKKFLDEFPELQIIATSHSPYILDKLEPNEVRVTGLGDDGSVVIAPITEHPDFARWKDSMTPGEFWSHTGEEWLKKLQRSAPTP